LIQYQSKTLLAIRKVTIDDGASSVQQQNSKSKSLSFKSSKNSSPISRFNDDRSSHQARNLNLLR